MSNLKENTMGQVPNKVEVLPPPKTSIPPEMVSIQTPSLYVPKTLDRIGIGGIEEFARHIPGADGTSTVVRKKFVWVSHWFYAVIILFVIAIYIHLTGDVFGIIGKLWKFSQFILPALARFLGFQI